MALRIQREAAETATSTTLKIDSDGNGSYEQYFRVSANTTVNEIHYGVILRTSVGSAASVLVWLAMVMGRRCGGRKEEYHGRFRSE